MSQTFVTSQGARVALGRELGRGGEGSVFEVAGMDGCVAKLYHRLPDPRKQAKLRYMASCCDRELVYCSAWPQDTLQTSARGPTVGFLMPRVQGGASLHMVYSPVQRWEDRPGAAWDFLLFVARNTAAAFEALHTRGHVLGDVNQGNVVVVDDSRVVLIDCDSFQVNANGALHLCEVGVSHFTPPELQGLSSFDQVVRTANHDNFGLALLIFHLLFGGRHPFSGVPLRTGVGEALETDIREFRYAYARDARRRYIAPPPRSLPSWLVPVPLEAMFHQAFTETGVHAQRPSARDWRTALDLLRKRLNRCRAAAAHVYPEHLAECPWCGLERQGVVYFVDATSMRPPVPLVLERAWAHIDAVPAPPAIAIPHIAAAHLVPRPLPANMPGPQAALGYRLLALWFAVLLCALFPAAWFFAGIAGAIAWALAGSCARLPLAAERARRSAALVGARQEFERLLRLAEQDAGPGRFNQKKAELARIRDEYRRLSQCRGARRYRHARDRNRDGSRAGRTPAVRRALLEARLLRGAEDLQRVRREAIARCSVSVAQLASAARQVAQAEKDLSIV